MVTLLSVPGLEAAEGPFLSGEDGEECSALSDGLSRLRSPSVMEVREKGYERLKEELAKAQRVRAPPAGPPQDGIGSQTQIRKPVQTLRGRAPPPMAEVGCAFVTMSV